MLANYDENYFHEKGKRCNFRIDLTDTTGSRDAVYIIRVVKDSLYVQVITYWGRNGSSLANKVISSNPATTSSIANAEQEAIYAANKKVAKNYNVQFKGDPTVANYSGGTPKTPPPAFLPASVKMFPLTSFYSKSKLEPAMLTENFVLEKVMNHSEWFFVLLMDNKWHLFSEDKVPQIEKDPDPKALSTGMIRNRGYVFLGYLKPDGNVAVFDIIDGLYADDPIRDIEKKSWKTRRKMMTVIFEDVYASNVDPYDTTLNVHLNDYMVDEAVKHVMFEHHKKSDECILIRNTNSKFYSNILVKS